MSEDEKEYVFDVSEYDETSEEPIDNPQINNATINAIKHCPAIWDNYENVVALNVQPGSFDSKKTEGYSCFIFSAVDMTDGKKVIIKFLDPLLETEESGDAELDFRNLFKWEAAILSFLKSNNHCVNLIGKLRSADICISLGAHEYHHKGTYFVLERIKTHLNKAFFDKRDMSYAQYAKHLRIFCQILNAVYSIHVMGVYHRDLKPSNIMATIDDARVKVILIDFASSDAEKHVTDHIRLFSQRWHGTESYGSPEVACGFSPTGVLAMKQDMYCLGELLYELLSYNTFYQELKNCNSQYIAMIENCRIYDNDGNTQEERLKVYDSYLDIYAPCVQKVTLHEAVKLPEYVKTQLNSIIQWFTHFDYKQRPHTQNIPEIRDKIQHLIVLLENSHAKAYFKARKARRKRNQLLKQIPAGQERRELC